MSQDLKSIAELALIAALPEMLADAKPNRALGKIKKAAAIATMAIENTWRLSKAEQSFCNDRIEQFKGATGWGKRERHVLTYVSFLLALFERKTGFKAIVENLQAAADYFTEEPKYHSCYAAGATAFEKWEAIWE